MRNKQEFIEHVLDIITSYDSGTWNEICETYSNEQLLIMTQGAMVTGRAIRNILQSHKAMKASKGNESK